MINRRSALFSLLCGSLATPALARSSSFGGGLVTLTYDDGLNSHLDTAAPALEARGLRGTFYVTWDNIKNRASEWQRLIARGHELANHTVTHPCGIDGYDWQKYGAREIAPLNRRLDGWYGGAPERRNFAYPCDVTDLGPGTPNQQMARFEALLRQAGVASARTSEGMPNSVEWVRRHPYRLQALAVGVDACALPQVADYLRRAQAEGKWAILIFHEIGHGGTGKGQTDVSVHDGLLDLIVKEGIRCRRVCDVVSDVQNFPA